MKRTPKAIKEMLNDLLVGTGITVTFCTRLLALCESESGQSLVVGDACRVCGQVRNKGVFEGWCRHETFPERFSLVVQINDVQNKQDESC